MSNSTGTSIGTERLVSQELLDSFKQNGFVLVPDLLTPEEVERFGEAVTEGVLHRTREHNIPMEERSNYQKSFLQCMNLWEDRPDVAPLTFHPKVCQAAAELMEVDACRVWHDQALIKEAHGRKTDAHQDHPYWPIQETNSITAWIPFVQSTLDNGALGYIPGSHAIGMRKFVNIFFGEPQDILAEPEIRDTPAGVPRGAAGIRRVSPRPHRAPRGLEQHRRQPVGAHDHLLPRRLDPRLSVPALLGRPRPHRSRPEDRQRRDSDRVAASGRSADPAPADRVPSPSNKSSPIRAPFPNAASQ